MTPSSPLISTNWAATTAAWPGCCEPSPGELLPQALWRLPTSTSPRTVETHVSNLLTKTGTTSRTELVSYVVRGSGEHGR